NGSSDWAGVPHGVAWDERFFQILRPSSSGGLTRPTSIHSRLSPSGFTPFPRSLTAASSTHLLGTVVIPAIMLGFSPGSVGRYVSCQSHYLVWAFSRLDCFS